MKIIRGGIVYQGDEWKNDIDILLEEGKILDIVPKGKYNEGQAIDADGYFVCPGFIDIHIHGCAGRDVMMAVLMLSKILPGLLPGTE